MKKYIPIIFLVGLIIIFFRQFFFMGLLPVPSDTIVGLYNPYRDLYAKEYPRGIPFKNFIITDPVRQEYPWRMESILQEKKLQLPLWNPYNFAGTPLFANQQSASLYPLNLLFFLLPFSFSWSMLIFLEPVLAGLFVYLFLRNRQIHTAGCLLAAIAFIFSGFFTSWLEWGTVDHVVLWLPLMLLAVDKLLAVKHRAGWFALYVFSLIASFLAGHLQSFFYLFLLSQSYFFLRWFIHKQNKGLLLQFIFMNFLALLLTSISWLPLFQFIFNSARNTDLSITAGWYLPWQHLIGFLIPDFFGNPTTLNYWGIWNYAELTGYIGIIGLLFAFFAIFSRKEKLVLFFSGWTLVSLLFALPTPLARLPFTLHLPFISTAQPTRLLFIVDFSLSILAGLGMDHFIKSGKKEIFIVISGMAVLFAALWAVLLLHVKLLPHILPEEILVARHNMIFPSIIFAVAVALIVCAALFRKKKNIFIGIIIALLLVSAFDGIRFADKFTPFAKNAYLFPSTSSLQYLQQHIGNYRLMATNSQILPPNFSLMYHLQSLDGYDPLYDKKYGELIAAMNRGKADIHTPFGFNRIITPQNTQTRLINLLGVKYVLSLSDLRQNNLRKVFQEGTMHVYENTTVFPRTFFVDHIMSVKNDQEAVNFLFDQKNNLRMSAAVLNFPAQQKLHSGVASIVSYQDNSVTIKTENSRNGFLVLTDVFYPNWHATIDGKKTQIYQTDLALRGVFIPSGTHIVEFTVQLF